MDAATRFDTQIVGALPVLTQYLDQLGLADTVDDVVPWEGDVPLGKLVEVLILNRLLNPKAIFRIDERAQKSSVTGPHTARRECSPPVSIVESQKLLHWLIAISPLP